MKVEQRLRELEIAPPTIVAPWGSYVHAKRVGNFLYLSGKQLPDSEGKTPRGKLGAGISVDEGSRHARGVGLMLIAVMRDALDGDLDRVEDIVKVLGMVNAAPGFRGPSQSRKWLLGPFCRGLRRARPSRPLSGRDELSAGRDPGRD